MGDVETSYHSDTQPADAGPKWSSAMAERYNNLLTANGMTNQARHNAGDPWNPGVGPSGQSFNGGADQYAANQGANYGSNGPIWSGISSPGATWNQSQTYTGPTASQFFGPLLQYTPIGRIAGLIGKATTGYMGTGKSDVFGNASDADLYTNSDAGGPLGPSHTNAEPTE